MLQQLSAPDQNVSRGTKLLPLKTEVVQHFLSCLFPSTPSFLFCLMMRLIADFSKRFSQQCGSVTGGWSSLPASFFPAYSWEKLFIFFWEESSLLSQTLTEVLNFFPSPLPPLFILSSLNCYSSPVSRQNIKLSTADEDKISFFPPGLIKLAHSRVMYFSWTCGLRVKHFLWV